MKYRPQEGFKKLSMVLVAILFSATVHVASSDYETSFDCEQASSKVEKMICSTGELAALDLRLARIYEMALELSANRSAVKARQRQWLATERNVCSDVECVKTAYARRIRELRPPLVISEESKWRRYVNHELGISIQYPDEMTVLTGKQAEYYYFVSLAKPDIRIAFPRKMLWGGNLSQASVSIWGNSNRCLSYKEKPGHQTPYDGAGLIALPHKKAVINGVTFHEVEISDGATGGNSVHGASFELLRNEKCFTVESLMEIGSSQEPVTDLEEYQKIEVTLRRVIRSLKFLSD